MYLVNILQKYTFIITEFPQSHNLFFNKYEIIAVFRKKLLQYPLFLVKY